MQIYLLRHGIAEDARPGQPDSERALTDEGREKLRRVLKRARTADVSPSRDPFQPLPPRRRNRRSRGRSASATRARWSAPAALVPDASPVDAWEEIRSRTGEPAILLASHEPLMSTLAAFLLGSPALQVDMKKAALVRIDCDGFGREPRGVLKWMLTPGCLRR